MVERVTVLDGGMFATVIGGGDRVTRLDFVDARTEVEGDIGPGGTEIRVVQCVTDVGLGGLETIFSVVGPERLTEFTTGGIGPQGPQGIQGPQGDPGESLFDDYEEADTQPSITGADAVSTVTFDGEVQLVLVSPVGTGTAWVAVDADTVPADGTGQPAFEGQPNHYFGDRTSIDIYVPAGLVVHVTGYRRTAL